MTPEDLLSKKDEIYFLYIVLAGLAGLVTFGISAWGVWWKVSQRRVKDLENIHGKIEKCFDEVQKKLSAHIAEIYKEINENEKEQSKINLEFSKEIYFTKGVVSVMGKQ